MKLTLLVLLTVAVFGTVAKASAIPCEDPECLKPEYTGTAHFACCSGLTLRAYCLQKLAEHAVITDGQCNPYITPSPTPPPPTKQPTRYIFPTQSPQSLADYNSYFSKSPTQAPTNTDGVPTPAGSSNSAAVGFGIAIVLVLAVFGGVVYYRRRRLRSSAMQETEFGAGSQLRMAGSRNNEYGVALT